MTSITQPEARVVSTGRDKVGESPVWDDQAQALYWVDIEGRHIHRLDWASKVQQTWNTAERVGCIALATDGRVIARCAFPVAGLLSDQGPAQVAREHEALVEAAGMALAAAVGAWYCLDERGLSPAHCDGLITPNGLAFSPDKRTMYFSDSHPSVQKIWAFDFDLALGQVGEGREFLDMTQMPGRPDGAAVDSEGCYWICGNDAGLVHRIAPGGEWLSSLQVPVAKPSMCAFGGPQLDTLLVTSICPAGVSGGLCGAVFALDAGIRGRPEPRFSRFPSAGA